MKRSLPLLALLLIVSLPLSAQTNVDKLAHALDSLSMVAFDDWRMSPDLKSPGAVTGDPTQPGYDDSKWTLLKLGQSVYPDSCWLRKEITLPARVLGQPLSGPVRFLVSVDDYGYLWVNGESRGHFPWDGEFELTRDAKPGEKIVLAVKAINTGGPLRLLRAEMQSELVKPIRRMAGDLALSLRVGQKLLSFDTYQTNARKKEDPGIDKSKIDKAEKIRLNALLQDVASRVEIKALAGGNLPKFTASIDAIRTQLKPVAEFAKRFTLYFDGNAHIDAAWLWREKETIEVCSHTFSSVFNIMNAQPDFTYTQTAAAYYDWMERLEPEVFRGIQERVKQGRWEITGGMWVEPDCNLPSGDSWMRHLLYAKRYFKEKFGIDVVIGWNPDSFGYNWNMPMFYKDAGIDAFITQKIGWNERNVFPHRLFWWESPDGSRILSYFPFDYVNTVDDPERLVDWLRQFDANTGMTKLLILFGIGNHGGGPSIEMIDRIKRLTTLDIFPTIEYGTTGTYLSWLRGQDLSDVPVWNDELYLEYHQGTYTTQAKMKESNRKSETLLLNAEKFSTLSTLYGGAYNGGALEGAWRHTLFNQFHDILPGSSIREVYIDATERYKDVDAVGQFELHSALKNIAKNIGTSAVKQGTPVVVFNPLAWERTDIVSVPLPDGENGMFAVYDLAGRELPSQQAERSILKKEILFRAENVPSLGYRVFEVREVKGEQRASRQAKGERSLASPNLTATATTIENQFFRVTADADSGWVRSIVDKRSNREILQGYGNELQILEDKPSAWDAWNIGLTGVKYPSKLRSVKVVEQGPVRVVLRIVRDYLKPGVKKDFPTEDFPSTFFTQDVILYDGIDRIDFATNVDWWEEKTMLKVAFPVTVTDTAATYEIPFGTIRRSTQWATRWDSAKVEVPAQRWADLSNNGYGVSLLNRAKYGYDIKENVMRLSLLRSPKWPDPTADRGKHTIEYALYPHAGDWREAGTVRRGYEYNTPLLVVNADAHKGSLPVSQSLVTLEPASLVLTTVKKAEDSDAWIVQWYDSDGSGADAVLTLPKAPKNAVLSSFMETDGAPVTVERHTLRVPTRKHGVVTVKVEF